MPISIPKSNIGKIANRARTLVGPCAEVGRVDVSNPWRRIPLGVNAEAKNGKPGQGERLQRVLAQAGVAARRVCERMIEEGRIRVNGRVVRTLPCFVTREDRIQADGQPITRAERPIYVMFNKPDRVLTATQDEPGIERTTIASLVKHPSGTRLFPVGRLEYHATGLVLLTNDGQLTHRLTHARFGIAKVYHAVISGSVTAELLQTLESRIARAEKKVGKREGTLRSPRVSLGLVAGDGQRAVVSFTLKQGTASQVVTEFRAAGLKVKAIERVAIGPLELTGVARGAWRELTRQEIRMIKAAARGELTEVLPASRPSRPGLRPDQRQGRDPRPYAPKPGRNRRTSSLGSAHWNADNRTGRPTNSRRMKSQRRGRSAR